MRVGGRYAKLNRRVYWRLFLGAAAGVVLLAATGPASAASRTYTYSIEHQTYGVIGVYSDTVDEDNGIRRIDTHMHVAVKALGITLYREDADRTELWRGAKLILFHGMTTVDGSSIEVRGEAQNDGFVITSRSGTVVAPSNIYTSSPWSVNLPNSDIMMSNKDGRIVHVYVANDGVSITSMNGSEIPLRHFEIHGDVRQDVWVDLSGVPVHFRTLKRGAMVDFILKPESFAALIASRH